MEACTFCPIATGDVDTDLVAHRTEGVFVLPALRQRPANRGHTLVLPVVHVPNLHDAPTRLRDEIFAVTAQLTAVAHLLYGADGSTVFFDTVPPDDRSFHLHVHVVPRFLEDGFVMTRAAVQEVSRAERAKQAARIRAALVEPCPSSR